MTFIFPNDFSHFLTLIKTVFKIALFSFIPHRFDLRQIRIVFQFLIIWRIQIVQCHSPFFIKMNSPSITFGKRRSPETSLPTRKKDFFFGLILTQIVSQSIYRKQNLVRCILVRMMRNHLKLQKRYRFAFASHFGNFGLQNRTIFCRLEKCIEIVGGVHQLKFFSIFFINCTASDFNSSGSRIST